MAHECVDVRPPVGSDVRCPKCKKHVEYVHVPPDADHAHSMPCGCAVRMPEVHAMIKQSAAWT